jgi:hypothetical protein
MARRRPPQDRSRRRSRDLVLEALEGRQMLSANVAIANDAGEASSPLVRLVDAESGAERASVLAFEPTFKGGVRLAMGRVTGNADPDVVVGSGSGRVNEVKVFKPLTVGSTTTLTQVLSFRPFGDAYRGGIEVAVGDIDGDGIHDIIVGKSRDGGDVKVFRVTNPGGTTTVTPYATIAKPFGATYNGGSSVGVADVGEFSNSAFVKSVGDNKVEVLVGSGAGIPARVRVYDVSRPATPRVADAFSPFGPLFQGGVSLTSGRYAASGVADSVDDIVVSAGRGGASQMRVFDGTVSAAANTVLRAFTPYASLPRPNAAVFAAAVDVDGNGQIDGFRTTQGDPGASAGVAKVSVAGARTGNPLVSVAAPLRIAAARTVFATQTINGTVATPSPTAGVTAGTSRPMQIREIVTGSGATANPGNTLTVQYTGMLTNGTVFDSDGAGAVPVHRRPGAGHRRLGGRPRGDEGRRPPRARDPAGTRLRRRGTDEHPRQVDARLRRRTRQCDRQRHGVDQRHVDRRADRGRGDDERGRHAHRRRPGSRPGGLRLPRIPEQDLRHVLVQHRDGRLGLLDRRCASGHAGAQGGPGGDRLAGRDE